MTLKLDTEMAWTGDLLINVLTTLSLWIGWIMEYIMITSFLVLVNGISGDSFKVERGVRHGDFIFPYVFIICTEYLDRYCNFM